jgi:tRNA threonylcarbamoyl adenosine modification protein (Sua5/YciO/YrdC/YwlC family)
VERIFLPAEGSWTAAAARAAAVLNQDGIAVLPAEGVYGLHVRPDRHRALERLAALKPRAAGRGWIGLLAEPELLARYAASPEGPAHQLARDHWPGALTLIVPASDSAPESLRASNGTVALRCPGSDFLRAVARACGGIILSTSANDPGAPAPARAEDVALAEIDLLIDQGPLSGEPSTIVSVEGTSFRTLRQGSVRIVKKGAGASGDEGSAP